MASVPYTVSRDKLMTVTNRYGNPFSVQVEVFNDSGTKQVPYVKAVQPFTARTVTLNRMTALSYSGDRKEIAYTPWAGPNDASNAAMTYLNKGSWLNISQTETIYQTGVTKNVALSRFVEEIMKDMSTSSLGVSVIEGRDSLKMIGHRVGNLARTLWYLKKGDLAQAKKAFSASLQTGRFDTEHIIRMRRKKAKYFNDLKMRMQDHHRIRPIDIERAAADVKRRYPTNTAILADKSSSLWLEYWLGWAPFVSDVDKLLDVLSTATARLPSEGAVLKSTSARRIEKQLIQNTSYYSGTADLKFTYRYTITGKVSVNDPEQFLNRRAGLTNLPAVIWAGVPFSFIIDWFVGIGKVLELTDSFTGLTWHSGTVSETISGYAYESYKHRASPSGTWRANTVSISYIKASRRTLQTVAPTGVLVPKFKDLSQIFEGKEHRAYTSVSLLTSFLLNHRAKR